LARVKLKLEPLIAAFLVVNLRSPFPFRAVKAEFGGYLVLDETLEGTICVWPLGYERLDLGL
jgi:hypothetical protein